MIQELIVNELLLGLHSNMQYRVAILENVDTGLRGTLDRRPGQHLLSQGSHICGTDELRVTSPPYGGF